MKSKLMTVKKIQLRGLVGCPECEEWSECQGNACVLVQKEAMKTRGHGKDGSLRIPLCFWRRQDPLCKHR